MIDVRKRKEGESVEEIIGEIERLNERGKYRGRKGEFSYSGDGDKIIFKPY